MAGINENANEPVCYRYIICLGRPVGVIVRHRFCASAEFSPFDKTLTGIDGRGNLYARFIVEEVKPMIDRTYRIVPDRAHTAIAGSFLGGLVTLATAHNHPNVFVSVVVLDPWLRDS